ncbi:hypothetical protein [Burkholderia pseudomallei]|uniref:hypothetical protein n=1 Tax=Burkholderia pseudomallei TaxID=28450 RepID=UPI0021F7C0C2|nr:hypothetical protein [Burkholderia pseudomallei]MCW0025484.1 hypothetical protein [Burkholderia pseudomallei]MCW0170291.1 hypothetical protein [Burkholderia pseudomallei]
MRIENLRCVHVRTIRRPARGEGARSRQARGARFWGNLLLPGARRPGGARYRHHDRAQRACRCAAGHAARGDGFKRTIRDCLCIFRSLIQNGILTQVGRTR